MIERDRREREGKEMIERKGEKERMRIKGEGEKEDKGE